MTIVPKIVLVGGGSVNWTPKLLNDLTLTPSLAGARYTIYDKDEEAAGRMARLGEKLARDRGLAATFDYAMNEREAFAGASFFLITISTGELDAMAHDLDIPERYRIYQTVGDTVGPGGWARALRNIPVFAQLARSMERYAPNAVVLNYTNPLATLTKTFYAVSGLKTVGLCHGVFETYDALMNLFGLESEEEIKVRFGGTNHFFWILDMRIRGEDGYAMLRHRLKDKKLSELLAEGGSNHSVYASGHLVCEELFERTGFLPYIADRHTSEFLPAYLTGDVRNLERHGLKRTTIADRRAYKQGERERLTRLLDGAETLPDRRSRESAADILGAFASGREFIDVVNVPNAGQIRNLPPGSVVETLGVVNRLGFTPLTVGDLPEPILNMVLPHVNNQNLIVEAALIGNKDQALHALYNDPLCAHLTWSEIREMGLKLLEAHRPYLPQFYSGE
ncbi:hypothetical protein [Cohnella sp. GCM10027633]|uniref:family 4 glycosyl hydrolase n=1 Tax=unclassified Cohnella TaxID=2636738 RepID=UPI00364187E6